MTPLEFLTELWQYKPEDQFILIWTGQEKRSRWFTSLAEAAAYVGSLNGAKDIYTGVGLSGKDYGPARRCVSEEIKAIAGIGGDFDLLSDAHKNKALPQTIDQALSILPQMMPPTLIIATGNGIQAWWLLKEPYVFEDEEDRRRVGRIVARWHTMLRLNAANRGWSYERLADLARVLRIPGTRNCKDPAHPKDVVLHSATGQRYNLSEFSDLLDAAGIPDSEAQEKAAREWKERFADKPLVVNLKARIPQETLDAWMDPANSDEQTALRFRHTWNRQRHDLKDSSKSGYDMALVNFGLDAGLSEQQIVDLIVHHRAERGLRQNLDAGYYRRTIAKALATREDKSPAPAAWPPAAGGSEAPPSTTPPWPAVNGAGTSRSTAPPPQPEAQEPQPQPTILSPEQAQRQAKLLLCQEISIQLGVEVIQIIRLKGKEPTYHMHLDQGIVEFASVDKLINYGPLLNAIAAKTGKIIRDFKPKEWKLFRQKLLDACIDEECTEEEDFEDGARADILDYLAETDFIAAIEGQRIQDQRRPMVVEGRIAICSSDFVAYLDKTKNRKITTKMAASMFGAVGAKKTQRFRASGYASQSRWALPLPEFDPRAIKPGLAATTQADAKSTEAGETIQ